MFILENIVRNYTYYSSLLFIIYYIIMTTKKKLTKIVIILILVVFLVITWLSAVVPYLWGNKNVWTGDILSWDMLSWDAAPAPISTWVDAMWL